MLALRRSVIDFVLPLVIPSSVDLSLTTVPQYWDEQLRIDHELKPAVEPVAVERRHRRHLRAVHDQGGRAVEAVLHPDPVPAADRRGEVPRRRVAGEPGAVGMLAEIDAEVGLYQRLDVRPRWSRRAQW